jgi:hypothetical protein
MIEVSDYWTAHGDANIRRRINRAQDVLEPKLTRYFGEAEVLSWDTNTPQTIKDLCADWAAGLIYVDELGEAQMKPTSPGGQILGKAQKTLDGILRGDIEVLSTSGNIIEHYDVKRTKVWSNTSGQDREFSKTELDKF